jgi:hypothetical protein
MKGGEILGFYPEDLHRGQREEFEALALLGVSEVWMERPIVLTIPGRL